jgi:hypothetical protein
MVVGSGTHVTDEYDGGTVDEGLGGVAPCATGGLSTAVEDGRGGGGGGAEIGVGSGLGAFLIIARYLLLAICCC